MGVEHGVQEDCGRQENTSRDSWQEGGGCLTHCIKDRQEGRRLWRLISLSQRRKLGVMDWGQKTKRMTEQGTKVGARAQESGVPEGITSLESCSGQVGGLYGCQDTVDVPEGCQGVISIQNGDQVREQDQGEGGGQHL